MSICTNYCLGTKEFHSPCSLLRICLYSTNVRWTSTFIAEGFFWFPCTKEVRFDYDNLSFSRPTFCIELDIFLKTNRAIRMPLIGYLLGNEKLLHQDVVVFKLILSSSAALPLSIRPTIASRR